MLKRIRVPTLGLVLGEALALGCLFAALRCHASRVGVDDAREGPDAQDARTDARDARDENWVWGVTVDDVSELEKMVDALKSLPRRPTTRIVFDEGITAATYRPAVTSIHGVSAVMG